jgi:hypothetical protein
MARSTEVRVSIAVGWGSVSGPAGVADTNLPRLHWMSFNLFNQVLKFASFFASLQAC